MRQTVATEKEQSPMLESVSLGATSFKNIYYWKLMCVYCPKGVTKFFFNMLKPDVWILLLSSVRRNQFIFISVSVYYNPMSRLVVVLVSIFLEILWLEECKNWFPAQNNSEIFVLLMNNAWQLFHYCVIQIRSQLGMGEEDQAGAIVACYLAQNGASLTKPNHQGKTPLQCITDPRVEETVKQFAAK